MRLDQRVSVYRRTLTGKHFTCTECATKFYRTPGQLRLLKGDVPCCSVRCANLRRWRLQFEAKAYK